MRVPKKVLCEFTEGKSFICEVDQEGWGRCGDYIINEDGEVCPCANEVLDWQDIKPVFLKGSKHTG
jgi:hypothetical protein